MSMATTNIDDSMLDYDTQKNLLLGENQELRLMLQKMSKALSYIIEKRVHKHYYMIQDD
jgi:hypothetical protein